MPIVYNEVNKTFDYTGSAQTWTVPDGVTSVSVDAYGASSSINTYYVRSGYQAKGGRVETELSVSPRETLYLYVGGHGSTVWYSWGAATDAGPQAGGWNGGGNGISGSEAGGGATHLSLIHI